MGTEVEALVRMPRTCPGLRLAVRYYRRATWDWQERMSLSRTDTEFVERRPFACGLKRWAAELWRDRAGDLRDHYARRLAAREEKVPDGICWACWDRVAACESGGDWSINTGNGFHGGLQFLVSTWLSAGGGRYASMPEYASREEQIIVASGLSLSNWPVCGARYYG